MANQESTVPVAMSEVAFGRQLREGAVFLSDNDMFKSMMASAEVARRNLTYFLVTGSAALMGIYWNTKNDVIQDFFPGLGIVFCIAIMIIGEREFDVELQTCKDAMQFRRDNGMSLGAFATRYDQLIYTAWHQVSKVDFVAILTAIAWVVFGIGVYSVKG